MTKYVIAVCLDEEEKAINIGKVKKLMKEVYESDSKEVVIVDLNHSKPDVIEKYIKNNLIDSFMFSAGSIQKFGSKTFSDVIKSSKTSEKNITFLNLYTSTSNQSIEDAVGIGDIMLNDNVRSSLVHINIEEDSRILKQTMQGLKYSAIKQRELMQKIELNMLEFAKKIVNDIKINKGDYTAKHISMVNYIARCIGEKLGISNEDLDILRYGTLLHDIGKLDVDGNILNKSEKFTTDEWKQMQQHVVFGEIRLNEYNLGPFERAKTISAQHHERYDGNGYPNGLQGEEIDILSRIASVADAVHAMFGRNYQSSKTIPEIIADLRKNSGKQFDPNIANIMCEILDSEKFKEDLQLKFDENGKIISYTLPNEFEKNSKHKRAQQADELPI